MICSWEETGELTFHSFLIFGSLPKLRKLPMRYNNLSEGCVPNQNWIYPSRVAHFNQFFCGKVVMDLGADS